MARTLEELLDIVTATDPTAADDFLDLLKPEKFDKVEMGSIFDATLGYNPIDYYDKKDISSYIEDILAHPDIPDDIKTFVKDNRDDIIDESYRQFEQDRAMFMHGPVDAYIEECTGTDITKIMDPFSDDDEDFDLTDEDEDDL